MLGLAVVAAAAASGCSRGTLDTHSADAARIAHLWWVTFGISTALFVIIMGIFSYALFHRRGEQAAAFERDPAKATGFVLIAGAVIPLFILVAVFAYSVKITAANTSHPNDPLHITVIGHDWWWEFQYTDTGVRTVNTIHIPAGRPIAITLAADDVIHSFWVPQLNGKTDAIPGILNHMTIESDDPGAYRGVCAEFCGVGHACMDFELVVDEKQDFDAWVNQVKAIPYRQPTRADVQYMLNACVNQNKIPVCQPTGCPSSLPAVPGPTPSIPQFNPSAGSPSNNTGER
ncbi:MAG: cytochrome c oxidase subunit II [Gemmatimonadaceae bacterium]